MVGELEIGKQLDWWCCFRDAALEARFRRQSMLAAAKARVLIAAIFSLIAALKISTAVTLLGEEWTIAESSLCTFGVVCVVMACTFSSKPFCSLHHGTQSNIVAAGFIAFAAYQSVHIEYRLEAMIGGRSSLTARSECDFSNSVLPMHTCAWLAVLLVQDLDLRRYAIIVTTSVTSKMLWHLVLPLQGGTLQFARSMFFHVLVIALIMLAKARMNVAARASYLLRIKVREDTAKLADEVIKASVAERARARALSEWRAAPRQCLLHRL